MRYGNSADEMKFRIRPQEITITERNPFENDLLNREESVEILTRLLGALEGPSVLAVDAAWGNGKSTFIRLWEQHLRNRGFATVAFNAWENDFSRNPFVALSSELLQGLSCTESDDKVAAKLESMKKAGMEFLKRSVPATIRLLTHGVLDISPLVENEIGQLLASYAENRLAEYEETQKSVREFKCELQDLAKTLSVFHGNRPLVIFIDELDRCRPSYAIELLEIAKHFFAADHIVFVLAVNRAELAHSVKAFYGSDFDTIGYLRRFIDIDFRLPDPDRSAFVSEMLAELGVDDFLEQREGFASDSPAIMRNLLRAFFGVPDLSLRRAAQAIHRLGLVLTLLQNDGLPSYVAVATALILRTINPDMCHSFFRGSVSDLEVANDVFSRPESKSLRRSPEGILFETMLIIATHEDGTGVKRFVNRPDQPLSPLLKHYHERTTKRFDESDQGHAHRIISCVKEYQHLINAVESGRSIGFREAAELLELFSNELLDESLDEMSLAILSS